MIRKGQRVWIKPERADAGDNNFARFAVANEDGGRVLVVTELGWTINPSRVELVADLATEEPQ